MIVNCYMSPPFLLGVPNSHYFQLQSHPCHTWVNLRDSGALLSWFLVDQNSLGISLAQIRRRSKDTRIGISRGLSTGRTSAPLSYSFIIRYGPWNGFDSLASFCWRHVYKYSATFRKDWHPNFRIIVFLLLLLTFFCALSHASLRLCTKCDQ